MPGGDVVATVPELWATLIEICNEVGININTLPTLTTAQEIVEYMYTIHNIELVPLYNEVTTLQQTGWTWVVNTPADPTTTTDLVVRGVTDLTVVGGGATGITQGKRLFGTISKRIAAGAMIGALGVSTFISQMGEHFAKIDELVELLTPWTTDGENVPVMIDENGNTYLDERAIQEFRKGLVNMGIFEGNSYFEPLIDVPLPSSITQVYTATLNKYVGDSYVYYVSPDLYDYGYDNNRYRNFYVRFPIDNQPTDVKVILTNSSATSYYYLVAWTGGPSSTYAGACDMKSGFPQPLEYSNMSTSVSYNGNTGHYGYSYISGYTVYGVSPNTFNLGPSGGISSNTRTDLAKTILWGVEEGGAVPGFEPANKTVGDLTKDLTDIFPDWTDNGLTMPSPKDDDLDNKSTWLPVSVTDTNPFTSDHTATSDEQDGDTSEDVENKILEQMMELIQSLLKDPDKPDEVITPTIEVGDSGDSPPAAPPLVSGASNGLWTIYNPTLSEVQQFGGWLWSESIIDQIIRQFNNPIQAVIGFMTLYATPITGDRKVIKAGYLSSPVSAKEVTNQYITIDCGSVEVPEYYKTAIDYTRSKVDIFLPFIGIVPLDCSVVTGSTLQVIYRIDVLTGTCLAQVKVIKQNSNAVMYTYTGNCAVQLPLTASTYTGMVGALMGLASASVNLATGNVPEAIGNGIGAVTAGISNLTGTAKSGSLASNAGALGIRIPYLIITHPTAYDAFVYNQVYGYPSNIYQRLSAMSGFVRVKDVHLDDISCTDQELDMIYRKLKEGVII